MKISGPMKSEIIDEGQEGWPEYVYKLPEGLNEQILSKQMGEIGINQFPLFCDRYAYRICFSFRKVPDL